jgi:hypothetical protein
MPKPSYYGPHPHDLPFDWLLEMMFPDGGVVIRGWSAGELSVGVWHMNDGLKMVCSEALAITVWKHMSEMEGVEPYCHPAVTGATDEPVAFMIHKGVHFRNQDDPIRERATLVYLSGLASEIPFIFRDRGEFHQMAVGGVMIPEDVLPLVGFGLSVGIIQRRIYVRPDCMPVGSQILATSLDLREVEVSRAFSRLQERKLADLDDTGAYEDPLYIETVRNPTDRLPNVPWFVRNVIEHDGIFPIHYFGNGNVYGAIYGASYENSPVNPVFQIFHVCHESEKIVSSATFHYGRYEGELSTFVVFRGPIIQGLFNQRTNIGVSSRPGSRIPQWITMPYLGLLPPTFNVDNSSKQALVDDFLDKVSTFEDRISRFRIRAGQAHYDTESVYSGRSSLPKHFYAQTKTYCKSTCGMPRTSRPCYSNSSLILECGCRFNFATRGCDVRCQDRCSEKPTYAQVAS